MNRVNLLINFDVIAKSYDLLKYLAFGKKLEIAENFLLSSVPNAKNVLVLGGGTGAFMVELLKCKKAEKIVYVDSSKEMTALAYRRLKTHAPENMSMVEFRTVGIESISIEETFDMICTNYFLDLFNDKSLEYIFYLTDKILATGGVWYFTDFSKNGHWQHQLLIRLLYKFFKITTNIEANELPDFESYFKNSGYEEKDRKLFMNGLVQSIIYAK